MRVREEAVLALTPNESHLGKDGYAVVYAAGPKAALVTANNQIPIGVITEGQDVSGKSAIAICEGSVGSVHVQLDAASAACKLGDYLTITATGTFEPTVTGHTQCARALEAGNPGERIEAVLYRPITAP